MLRRLCPLRSKYEADLEVFSKLSRAHLWISCQCSRRRVSCFKLLDDWTPQGRRLKLFSNQLSVSFSPVLFQVFLKFELSFPPPPDVLMMAMMMTSCSKAANCLRQKNRDVAAGFEKPHHQFPTVNVTYTLIWLLPRIFKAFLQSSDLSKAAPFFAEQRPAYLSIASHF